MFGDRDFSMKELDRLYKSGVEDGARGRVPSVQHPTYSEGFKVGAREFNAHRNREEERERLSAKLRAYGEGQKDAMTGRDPHPGVLPFKDYTDGFKSVANPLFRRRGIL